MAERASPAPLAEGAAETTKTATRAHSAAEMRRIGLPFLQRGSRSGQCIGVGLATGRDRMSQSEKATFMERIEVISFPARVELVDALTVVGSATTTQLGQMVPEAKAAIRWHVARLEEAGFIRQKEGAKPGVWEPAQTKMAWSPEDADDPDVTLALQELERVLTDRRRRRLGEWALARWERPWAGTDWADAAISRDYIHPGATAPDLMWLDERIVELMTEFRERATSGPEAEPVFITFGAFPWRPGGQRR